MVRSGTVNTIREMARAGKPVRAIAKELGIARNTVRKYVRSSAAGVPRRKRKPSKLDPFKPQIRAWVEQDHLYSCETILRRVQALGYTGQLSILKDFVRPLRPPRAAARQQPVLRYETKPGEQLQFDWGEFVYEHEGVSHKEMHKVFGFTAVLGYSRMRFLTFAKRTDAPTLIRCLLEAFEYVGGVPQAVLTDRMKTVLLDVADGQLHWHPQFADRMTSLGVTMRVCKPYTPQTKGKVERSVGLVKSDFWPGVRFTDLDDLNRQALSWCDALNHRVHRTTHQRPSERLGEEGLRPLPDGWVWERFAAEERTVSLEGYVSYDGVLYGVPESAALVGRRVQVVERSGHVLIYASGRLLLRAPKEPRSGTVVTHPTQFAHTPSAAAARRIRTPVGHQLPAPAVTQRPLDEYDWLCGLVPTHLQAQEERPAQRHEEMEVVV
jgi:transposase